MFSHSVNLGQKKRWKWIVNAQKFWSEKYFLFLFLLYTFTLKILSLLLSPQKIFSWLALPQFTFTHAHKLAKISLLHIYFLQTYFPAQSLAQIFPTLIHSRLSKFSCNILHCSVTITGPISPTEINYTILWVRHTLI